MNELEATGRTKVAAAPVLVTGINGPPQEGRQTKVTALAGQIKPTAGTQPGRPEPKPGARELDPAAPRQTPAARAGHAPNNHPRGPAPSVQRGDAGAQRRPGPLIRARPIPT